MHQRIFRPRLLINSIFGVLYSYFWAGDSDSPRMFSNLHCGLLLFPKDVSVTPIFKILVRTLRPNYIFNNYAYFLDFRAQKFPLIFLNLNPFKHQQALHFGVLNYEKQHKEGTCKVLGRSVIFSAFYADFCFCPKLMIITTLRSERKTRFSLRFCSAYLFTHTHTYTNTHTHIYTNKVSYEF